VQVATHGDDARHKRSYVSIEIDNERVRLLFHRAEIFLPITGAWSLLQKDSDTSPAKRATSRAFRWG